VQSTQNRIQSSHAGNPQIMAIMPEFVAGLPAKVRQMTNLLECKDSTGLQNLAHQLLGTCGGYGFAEVALAARSVEQSIKAGRSLDFVTPEILSLIEITRRIDGYDESAE